MRFNMVIKTYFSLFQQWDRYPRSTERISCCYYYAMCISIMVKGIAVPVERHGVLQTLICAPMVRPKQCPTSSNPALLRSWMVVCPSSTLLMMLLLPAWPTMGLNRIRKKKNFSNFLYDNENDCDTFVVILQCHWFFLDCIFMRL